jgi:hypothetical protein
MYVRVVEKCVEKALPIPMGNMDDVMYESSSAHYSPLLDIGLSNFSPSRSIFGYSHPL